MASFSVVILTAAPMGQNTEAGGAFVKIDGREALLRSVELFLNRDEIKQIQVVVMSDELEEAKRKYGPHLSFSGVKLISGGPRWTDQIKAAGQNISADATHVILHDAARPLVPFSDIDALIEASQKNDVVVLTAPLRSELIQVDEGGNPLRVWNPDEFVQVMLPQVYSKATFARMAQSGQELSAVHATLLKGSPLNLRIRGAGDASLAKCMMSLMPKPKVKPPGSPFEEAQW
ncbi:MAG TPA: 2-C-methyl-D-erythritol 4-phosphate cytidylyltransferase [Tepidisphaeraceae bacterium]|nr:2-C-methyl-D-erythritol 4-phosphate cytidylyltransferase [Tepidisphaeraceae bacterium]